jgi:hypothetical protein
MPKRGSNQRKYAYLAILLFVIVVVSAIVVSQIRSSKPSANQYFTVSHTASLGEFSNENKTVNISVLGLNVTAVGGDATDVQITMDAQADPLTDIYPSIAKGTSKPAEIQLKGYVTSLNDDGLFPVEFDIGSLEVQTSTFTIYIDPKEILTI